MTFAPLPGHRRYELSDCRMTHADLARASYEAFAAGGRRFVIRYDHRDTGRSATCEPGYTGADLIADAVGVLDAYGVAAAHVVGVSAGGAFGQLLALGFPDRVLSLVLISTSPATAAS